MAVILTLAYKRKNSLKPTLFRMLVRYPNSPISSFCRGREECTLQLIYSERLLFNVKKLQS